jgi:hypothetical protein
MRLVCCRLSTAVLGHADVSNVLEEIEGVPNLVNIRASVPLDLCQLLKVRAASQSESVGPDWFNCLCCPLLL